MKLHLVTFATFLAITAAWNPAPRDQCNEENVKGGTVHLPHEKYCQLFYICDHDGKHQTVYCPGGLLFAYGTGIATCVPADGFTIYSCPKWSCSSDNDIGRRYPDTCCGKYWECTAINTFSEKVCSPGELYDSVTEQCSLSTNCTNTKYCIDDFKPSAVEECYDSPTSDPCKYRSEGWPNDRQCPVGVSFDEATCSCSQFNTGCTTSGLSAEELMRTKEFSPICASSGRVSWMGNDINVFSDKIASRIDHYFYKSEGFSIQSGIALFFPTDNDEQPFIYDFYYSDNTLYAPMAIVMSVKFEDPNPEVNKQYNLLENRWSTDLSNTHCNPVTLNITAVYKGVDLGEPRWEFHISATGENNVVSRGSATISQKLSDLGPEYIRVVFTFDVTSGDTVGIGGFLTHRGPFGQISMGERIPFITDNRHMGSALKPNKCGWAIGRGFVGRLIQFSVHEGCSDFTDKKTSNWLQ